MAGPDPPAIPILLPRGLTYSMHVRECIDQLGMVAVVYYADGDAFGREFGAGTAGEDDERVFVLVWGVASVGVEVEEGVQEGFA